LSGNSHMFANMALPSVEVTEAEQPLSILSYEFVPDRAGAGKYRGGVPYRRDYRLETDEAVLSVRADRAAVQPFGLYGGSPGAPAENWFNPDAPTARPLPSKPTMQFRKGEVFRHVHAGGGGWGDPLERDPEAVLKDVRNEFLSAAKAAEDYGVIVDVATWTVDTAATERRRGEIRSERGWRDVPRVQRGASPTTSEAAE
jgi:N-methylhydantoinase B